MNPLSDRLFSVFKNKNLVARLKSFLFSAPVIKKSYSETSFNSGKKDSSLSFSVFALCEKIPFLKKILYETKTIKITANAQKNNWNGKLLKMLFNAEG